jgi:hypothetical protein
MNARRLQWIFCLLAGATACRAGLLPDISNGDASEFALRRAGSEIVASYRIGVTRDGLYRINASTLAAAGISNAVGSELRLYCATQEVAMYVSADGLLTSNDYAVFFGEGYDGYYTATNVYWLGTGGSGLRMATRSAAPKAGIGDVTSYVHAITMNTSQLYRAFYRPEDESIDHWFAALIRTNGDTSFVVSVDGPIVSEPAVLGVVLHGLTTNVASPDHRTHVAINGSGVADFLFDDQSSLAASSNFSVGVIAAGANTVSFRQTQSGVPDDRAYLEEFSIRYTRLLVVTNGYVDFRGKAGTNNYRIGSVVTNAGVFVLDVSDPAEPVLLTNVTFVAGAPRLRFSDITAQSNRYYMCDTSGIRTVSSLERVDFRDLADTNRQADYIVVCPYAFRPSAYRLLKHRFTNGLRVAVAPITDIYNEFSYGIKDAAAIKQFLGYAFHHWQSPPPKYAILLGDGSYDPRDYLRTPGTADAIPVHLGPTPYEWSSLDGWFATVNGPDMLVDIAVGRVPVTADSELSNVVGKIMAYEALSVTNAWHKKALLAADNVDGVYNFKGASTTNVNSHLLSNGFTRTTAYLDDLTVSQTRSVISNTINSGVYVVSYFGHGAVDLWADESIFNSNDVARLNNSILPLFTVLTCRNGDFDEPGVVCMAEQLVAKPNRGAIAAIAANALSIEEAAEVFANGFYEALMKTNDYRRVGDVMNAGLLKLWTASPSSTELLFYEVFGDPSLVVNPNQ